MSGRWNLVFPVTALEACNEKNASAPKYLTLKPTPTSNEIIIQKIILYGVRS